MRWGGGVRALAVLVLTLASSVAFAAEVRKIEVLYRARSQAKKTPPTAMIPSVFAFTRGVLRSNSHVGSSTIAGISIR